jgi:hypothetical protein
MTVGFVVRVFDTEHGRFVSQEFVAATAGTRTETSLEAR